MFDNVTIKATFKVAIPCEGGGSKTALVTVERVRHPSDDYGDGSAHVVTCDGTSGQAYMDTRYDMIQSDPVEWEAFWEAFLYRKYPSATDVIRVGFRWERGAKEGGDAK